MSGPAETIFVTGGAGFIGSAVVRQLLAETPHSVVTIDSLTYAGHRETLAGLLDHDRHTFEQVDIRNRRDMKHLFSNYRPDKVMHLAAESHVDRSIDDPEDFVQTNIVGSYVLLQTALEYWRSLDFAQRDAFRLHQVSTDEVYGSLGSEGRFTEQTPYSPRSPYSASKAAADHLARAWHHTYGMPIVISNCSNNYGPFQHPEKLIPLMILNALDGLQLPIYGDGKNVRDWLYVEDHANALRLILEEGRPGQTYNVGCDGEHTNLEITEAICTHLDRLRPENAPHARLISFVPDRPGHDRRYAMDWSKLETDLNWRPKQDLESGLVRTIHWYMDNRDWVAAVEAAGGTRERVGLLRQTL